MVRVAFYTLGCKLNQAETESLADQFKEAGYQLVAPDDVADIYIANTCTVTHVADRKSRHWLRLARRRNPRAFIIATGCYAQRAPQELAPIADSVVDNEEKEHLLEIVKGINGCEQNPCRGAPCGLPQMGRGQALPLQGYFAPNGLTRVRSLIKIQDGCRSPCAYCIVPQVRAYEYSLPASQIIDEVKLKVALGYREVVLTGTKIGCYEDNGIDLRGLIERILHDTDIVRLRLSSLQPQEISAQFLALWQDKRLCRHLHLALQSGSDGVLQRMKRCYSLDDYQRAIDLIRGAIPGVAITTDVMVGFPGESDEEFEQSCHFCQQAGFANIHVFPFSPRPGTLAARMPQQIDEKVKKERKQRMLELAQKCRHSFYEQFLGQGMPVLWEKETSLDSGIYSGLTDNYIRVFTRSHEHLTNKIAPVKLVRFHNQGMWGELVEILS
ncbi:MAG: tRNA (N(6)-L-threonylcarbamoyladenosine(37)-C(2))-methylthiotransferase MtaB [Dehalococcoidia bacterium]|nr:tRNA (N(6)-L-threonylcarbamoyladenosine(37)-C(2))-methylthiotransferase MtaB [Dehalococcoidia bacterium]